MKALLTEAGVRDRLSGVIDPCSLSMGGSVDICSLGMVEAVLIDGGHVRVEIVLTDPSCRFWQGIKQSVTDAVGELDGVTDVEVGLSRTAVWTPRRLKSSTAARA